MELILTETINLEVLKFPYELFFSWKHKRGVEKDWWFTATGKCKLWIGSLNTTLMGYHTEDDYKALVKEMVKYKSDILTDGNDYYTFSSDRIARINNMRGTLYAINQEWLARKDFGWEAINVQPDDFDYGSA